MLVHKTPLQLSQLHEKSLAKRIGGVTTIGSGNKSDKGDAKRQGFIRVEGKSTKFKSFSVTHDIVDKIEFEAARRAEIPFLTVAFLEGERIIKEVAIVPIYVLDMVRELLDERNGKPRAGLPEAGEDVPGDAGGGAVPGP